jgi:hypothetical protein
LNTAVIEEPTVSQFAGFMAVEMGKKLKEQRTSVVDEEGAWLRRNVAE